MANYDSYSLEESIYADEVLACVLLKKMFPELSIYGMRKMLEIFGSKQLICTDLDFEDSKTGNFWYKYISQGYDTYISGVKCTIAGLVFKRYTSKILGAYGIKTKNQNRIIKEIYMKYVRLFDAVNYLKVTNPTLNPQFEGNFVEYDLGLDKSNESNGTTLVYMRTIFTMINECDTFGDAFDVVDSDFTKFMIKIKIWATQYDQLKDLIDKIEENDVVLQNYRKDILLTDDMGNVSKIIREIEDEFKMDIKFVIDEEQDGFKIYTVPTKDSVFKAKIPLNNEWRGLCDEELSVKIGTRDCIYVHLSGLKAMNRSLDGALDMCYKSFK